MIQQTWSYRADSPSLQRWKFDPESMFERVREAYAAFAGDTGFELIPTGEAVNIYRKESKRVFVVPTPDELAKYRYPDLPPTADDIVGEYFWKKDAKGRMCLRVDATHLNPRGEYLQGCVWYGSIFGENPENITWEPPRISSSDCRAMRKAAARALAK